MNSFAIIENAVQESAIQLLESVWPDHASDSWHRYSGPMGEKLATLHWQCLPAEAWPVITAIGFEMARLYPECVVDWRLHGAGLHQINPGGCLPRHLDGEIHPRTNQPRWLSAVLFTHDSHSSFDGALVLEGRQHIEPKRGRLAIFETPGQWHEVLQTSVVRRTVALFGYKNEKTTGRISALFQPVESK